MFPPFSFQILPNEFWLQTPSLPTGATASRDSTSSTRTSSEGSLTRTPDPSARASLSSFGPPATRKATRLPPGHQMGTGTWARRSACSSRRISSRSSSSPRRRTWGGSEGSTRSRACRWMTLSGGSRRGVTFRCLGWIAVVVGGLRDGPDSETLLGA